MNGRTAVAAWNLMDGVIDWQGVPVLIEMYGIEDPEIFLALLSAIRKHKKDVATLLDHGK